MAHSAAQVPVRRLRRDHERSYAQKFHAADFTVTDRLPLDESSTALAIAAGQRGSIKVQMTPSQSARIAVETPAKRWCCCRGAVGGKKAPQRPVYFRIINQANVTRGYFDYLALPHPRLIRNEQIVASINRK